MSYNIYWCSILFLQVQNITFTVTIIIFVINNFLYIPLPHVHLVKVLELF